MDMMDRKTIEKGLITLVFSVIIYSALVFYGDLQSLVSHLNRVELTQILAVVLFTLFSLFLRFLRWERYLNLQSIDLGTVKSLEYFISGFSMIITPGKLGEGIKCYLMKKEENTPLSDGIPLVIAERALDLYSLILLSLATYSLLYLNVLHSLLLILAALSSTFIILNMRNQIIRKILNQEIFPVTEKIDKKMKKVLKLVNQNDELLNPKSQLVPLIYSLASWSLNGLSLYIILQSMAQQDFLKSLLSFSASSVAGALSMIPGGLGVVEGTMAGTLQILGSPKTAAIASTIVLRVFSFWLTFVLGATVLTYHLYRRRK
jgi:uncharacterized protein (TIRG00374 family)